MRRSVRSVPVDPWDQVLNALALAETSLVSNHGAARFEAQIDIIKQRVIESRRRCHSKACDRLVKHIVIDIDALVDQTKISSRGSINAESIGAATFFLDAINEQSLRLSALAGISESDTSAAESIDVSGLLIDLVGDYSMDADRQWRRSSVLYVTSGALMLGAISLAIFGLKRFSDNPEQLSGFLAYCGVATIPIFASILALRQAERHRRAAAECQRLKRQLAALDPYLKPFPLQSQPLMRAALAPRLFPGTLDDDDPLREPNWPTSKDLLDSIEVFDEAKSRKRSWIGRWFARS